MLHLKTIALSCLDSLSSFILSSITSFPLHCFLNLYLFLMDPYKQSLSTEGCSSSESGWTRYIASPMQDDVECSEDNYSNYHNIKDDDDDADDGGEGNSDDSMVSDASSAPSHHQHKQKDGQGSHSNARLKHDKGDYTSKHSSRKEAKKEAKKSVEDSSKSKRRFGGQAKSRK